MERKSTFNILQSVAIFEKKSAIINKTKVEEKRLLKKQNLPKQFITIKELNEISSIGNCDSDQCIPPATSKEPNSELRGQIPRRAKSLVEAIEFDFEDVDNPLTELELVENEGFQTQMSPPRKPPQKIYRTYSHKKRKEKKLPPLQINNQEHLDSNTDTENDEDEDGPLESFTTDGEEIPTQDIDVSSNSNIQGNLNQLSQFYAAETQDDDPVPKHDSPDYRTGTNIKLIDESMNDLFDDDERYMTCRSIESEDDPIVPVESVEPIMSTSITSQIKKVPNTITGPDVHEEIQESKTSPVLMKESNSLEKLNVHDEMPVFRKASGQKIEVNPKFKMIGENLMKDFMEASQDPLAFPSFQTASGHKIEVNPKFKMIGENLIKDFMETPQDPLAFPSFQTASGHKIEVNAESLKFGQKIFREIMETPENIGGESENRKRVSGEGIKIKTESIEIKQNMFKDLIESDDDELQMLNLDIPTNLPMFQKASGKKIEVPQKFLEFGKNLIKKAMEDEAPAESSPFQQKCRQNIIKSIFDTPIEATNKPTKPLSTSTPVSTNRPSLQKSEQKKMPTDEFKVEHLLDSETLKEFDSSWDNIDFGSIEISGSFNKNKEGQENLSNKRVASPSSHSKQNPSKYLKMSNRITDQVENSPANDYVSFHKSVSSRTSTPKPINRCLGILRRTSSKIILSPSLKPTRLSDKFKH